MTFTPQQLDMRPPGSILDWRIFDDGFIADGYRVLHLGPRNWLVTHDESIIGCYGRLKTAFISAERHRRQVIRLERVKSMIATVSACALSWLLLIHVLEWQAPAVWILFPITLIGASAVVKAIARLAGNPATSYFGPTPVAIRDLDGNQRRLRQRFYRA